MRGFKELYPLLQSFAKPIRHIGRFGAASLGKLLYVAHHGTKELLLSLIYGLDLSKLGVELFKPVMKFLLVHKDLWKVGGLPR